MSLQKIDQQEMLSMTLEDAVQALANLRENENLIASIYLSLDKTQANLRKIEQRLLVLQRTMGRRFKKEVLKIIKTVEENLRFSDNDQIKGMAMYVRVGEEPFNIQVNLPGHVDTEVTLNYLPSIFRLVEKKDIYHRYAVVILRKSSARIIQVNAGEITRNFLMGSMDLRSNFGMRISRDRYKNRNKERGNRFIKEKIVILDRILKDYELSHMILLGDASVTAQFKTMLPSHLEEKLIDLKSHSNIQCFEEILSTSIEAFVKAEDRESREAVELLRETLAIDGLAVAGYESVYHALMNQQLDKLIISRDSPEALHEDILRIAIQQDIDIETVEQDEFLDLHDGFAGFLRYRNY